MRRVCWSKFGRNPIVDFCSIYVTICLSLVPRQSYFLDFACLSRYIFDTSPELFVRLSIYKNAETCPPKTSNPRLDHLFPTQIALCERTRWSGWLYAVTTPVDKERMNSCVLERLFLWDSTGTKKIAKKAQKHSLQREANVKLSKFRCGSSTNNSKQSPVALASTAQDGFFAPVWLVRCSPPA